ncbi:hypothetical protein [Calothrix rhizosoleniae]|uniref:hypothetical protein n=1 Tax=Calothrix rhizosoleniae TaxID=888997 RepID=UPI001178A7C1|nr:hypothetical protein [Calothrix rhizosoleniae]
MPFSLSLERSDTNLHSVVVVLVSEIASFRSAIVAMTCGLSLTTTWYKTRFQALKFIRGSSPFLLIFPVSLSTVK